MLTTKIIDTFYMNVSRTFNNKANVAKYTKIFANYIDNNAEKLSTIGPLKRTLFTDSDRMKIYDLFGIDPDAIKKVAKTVPELTRSVNASDPFNIIMVLIIRYFRISKDKVNLKNAYTHLILSMYPSIHYKYFKYEPNEQIMNYTISNLSNKYKFKQSGNLLIALTDTASVADEHFEKAILRCNDKDIADYIMSFKTRINALIKNICAEYMKNHSKGNYLNYEEDNNDEDNFKVADNNSFLIKRVSDAVMLNLSIKGPDSKIIHIVSKMNEVSISDLRNTLDKLCKDKKNMEDIREVVYSIMYDFLFTGNHDQASINSTEFLIYSLETYKKSNTTNTNVVKIKNILDKWLSMYSETYAKTNRIATMNTFRKSLYMFFIFTIQKTSV